jgi:Protein of unknown function (DUF559)
MIWSALRGHRTNGASFRRQTPIGPYIVDFVCHAARLVIEIDGGSTSNQNKSNATPDEILTLPAKVFVFCALTIMTLRPTGRVFSKRLQRPPSLAPPRKRGRGRTEYAALTCFKHNE